MATRVQSMIAVAYVADVDVSRAFYELLGFREQASGRAGDSAWLVMRDGQVSMLLAMTEPALGIPPLPMLAYLFFEDVNAVVAALEEAGLTVERTGHPSHALGGEARVLDPDGNTLLLGQRERSSAQPPADDEGQLRFSILREAAKQAATRGGVERTCEIAGLDGRPCAGQAEVKLADSAGDSAWTCLSHAEQILVTVRAAFIADPEAQGIAAFLAGRQRPS